MSTKYSPCWYVVCNVMCLCPVSGVGVYCLLNKGANSRGQGYHGYLLVKSQNTRNVLTALSCKRTFADISVFYNYRDLPLAFRSVSEFHIYLLWVNNVYQAVVGAWCVIVNKSSRKPSFAALVLTALPYNTATNLFQAWHFSSSVLRHSAARKVGTLHFTMGAKSGSNHNVQWNMHF